MSDENKIPAPEPLKITRNGFIKELTPMQFGKKSNNAGAWFQAPVISPATFPDDVIWVGVDFMVRTFNKQARLICADIYLGNIDEATGKLDDAKYAAELADFTSGIAKLSDLEEDKEELEVQLAAAVNDPLFTETDDNDVATDASKALQLEAKRIGSLIKPIRKQIAEIEAKYAERTAKRLAKKQAEAAKNQQSQPTGVPVMA